MKIIKPPKSYSGKWALGFGVALLSSTVLSVIFALAIGGNEVIVSNNPTLSMLANILSIIFTLSGPLSFLTGIYTIIKYKEWSICKQLGIIYLLTFLLFISAEFLFPH